jgi:rSAM/selenodomain-associated transferase 2
MTVSVVIPTLNDNYALAELLASIRSWEQEPLEIIVVDALTDTACESICKQYQANRVSFSKNRGAQQKFGASHAKGTILWFLHADASPSSDALAYIHNEIDKGSNGGFFRFSFKTNETSISRSIITFFTNWRSRYFIAYGDQGIFVKKDFYHQVNGHADQPLFEEVPLIKALRRSGKLSISSILLPVSPRRWEKDGYWLRTLHNRCLALAYMSGVSADKLSNWYTSKKVQLPEN